MALGIRFSSTQSEERTCAVRRTSRRIFIAVVHAGFVAGMVIPPGTPMAAAQNRLRVVDCALTALRETLTTNARSYRPSKPVEMKVTIRNISSRTCSVAIGPTSPSLSIVNAKGSVVWNNCYAGDQPGACAMFLMLHTLNANTAYTLAKSWNQRSGANDGYVPRGGYVVRSNVSGVGVEKRIRIKLVS
jgi:hypothetical protein